MQDIKGDLILAFRQGRLERARELISSLGGLSLSACSESYILLCEALKNKQAAVAKLLLTCGSKVNIKSKEPSNTPLHFAVINDDIEIVKMILDKDANIEAKNRDGLTPLHIAAIYKREEVAKLLISYAADINAQDKIRNTPIFYAIDNYDSKFTKLLLTNRANIKDCPELLNNALDRGCLEIVEALLQHDCDVNASDEYGKTPIFYAIENYGSIFTKLLLTNGANIKDNPKLLNIAVERGSIQIVEALLQHDVDVNAYDKDGTTALHFAAGLAYVFIKDNTLDNNKGEIAKLLLTKGANADAQTKEGFTPLHIAAREEKEEVAKLLISYEADVNASNKYGETPIFYAIENADLKITKLLLTNGANIKDSPDLLITAVNNESIEILEALLQQDADITHSNEYERTLLHFGAETGRLKVVETLLKYGYDINIIDRYSTALDCAIDSLSDHSKYNFDLNYNDLELTAKALKSHIVKMKTAKYMAPFKWENGFRLIFLNL